MAIQGRIGVPRLRGTDAAFLDPGESSLQATEGTELTGGLATLGIARISEPLGSEAWL